MKITTTKVMEEHSGNVIGYIVGEKFKTLTVEMSEAEAHDIKEDIETLEQAIKNTTIYLANDGKISIATLNLLEGIRTMCNQKPLE